MVGMNPAVMVLDSQELLLLGQGHDHASIRAGQHTVGLVGLVQCVLVLVSTNPEFNEISVSLQKET